MLKKIITITFLLLLIQIPSTISAQDLGTIDNDLNLSLNLKPIGSTVIHGFESGYAIVKDNDNYLDFESQINRWYDIAEKYPDRRYYLKYVGWSDSLNYINPFTSGEHNQGVSNERNDIGTRISASRKNVTNVQINTFSQRDLTNAGPHIRRLEAFFYEETVTGNSTTDLNLVAIRLDPRYSGMIKDKIDSLPKPIPPVKWRIGANALFTDHGWSIGPKIGVVIDSRYFIDVYAGKSPVKNTFETTTGDIDTRFANIGVSISHKWDLFYVGIDYNYFEKADDNGFHPEEFKGPGLHLGIDSDGLRFQLNYTHGYYWDAINNNTEMRDKITFSISKTFSLNGIVNSLNGGN